MVFLRNDDADDVGADDHSDDVKVDRKLLMTNDLAKDALAPIWMVGDGRAKDAESQFGKGSTLGWPPLLSTG